MAHGPQTYIDVPAGLTRGWWACRCDMIAERMEKARTPELSRLAAEWRAYAREVLTKSDEP